MSLTHEHHHRCCIPQCAWLKMEKVALHAAVEGDYSELLWGSLRSWPGSCFEPTLHLEKWNQEGFSLWVCRPDHRGWHDHWLSYSLSTPWKRSSASLGDSSGSWWKDEIFTFSSVVLDSGKYFFRNFSITSSHVRKLFPLNEWSHLFASPAKDNKINWGEWRLLALPLSSSCCRSRCMWKGACTDLHLDGHEIDSPGTAG